MRIARRRVPVVTRLIPSLTRHWPAAATMQGRTLCPPGTGFRRRQWASTRGAPTGNGGIRRARPWPGPGLNVRATRIPPAGWRHMRIPWLQGHGKRLWVQIACPSLPLSRESRACPALDAGFFRGQWIPPCAGMTPRESGFRHMRVPWLQGRPACGKRRGRLALQHLWPPHRPPIPNSNEKTPAASGPLSQPCPRRPAPSSSWAS